MVRLPSDFRFEGSEVFIQKDSNTGKVILPRGPHSSWKSFLKLRDQIGVPDDFMSERGDGPPQKRKLF
jgi:antitoxin VapB